MTTPVSPTTMSISKILVGRMLALSIIYFLVVFIAAYIHFGAEESDERHLALRSFATYVSAQYAATTIVSVEDEPFFAFEKPSLVVEIERNVRYVVINARGDVVASSPELRAPLFQSSALTAELVYVDYQNPSSGEQSTGIAFPFTLAGQPYVLQAGMGNSDLSYEDTLADELVEFSWGLVFLQLLIPLVVWTVRGSLRPLTEISKQAATIGPLTMSRRLSRQNVPDEVLSLVNAVNTALDRIEDGFSREREFAANAAHELRTPLAVLHSRAEMLTSLDELPDLLRDLGNVERIVTQLLRLAQADNLIVDGSQRADLRLAATTAISMMAPLALKQGKEIELQGAEGPLMVKGDEEYLAMAIRNLLENALSVSPSGAIVRVVLEAPSSLTVRDTGPGISPELRPRIFSRFVRGKNTKASGAGLGLSIVDRIIAAHDGNIRVDSEEGHGAAFTITLMPGDDLDVSEAP